jgi:hypothetical protein
MGVQVCAGGTAVEIVERHSDSVSIRALLALYVGEAEDSGRLAVVLMNPWLPESWRHDLLKRSR